MSKVAEQILKRLAQFANDLRSGDLSKYRRTVLIRQDDGTLKRTVVGPKRSALMLPVCPACHYSGVEIVGSEPTVSSARIYRGWCQRCGTLSEKTSNYDCWRGHQSPMQMDPDELARLRSLTPR